MHKMLNELKEKLEEEIKKVTKKSDMSPTELENVTKAICLYEKIRDLEEGMMDGGYSQNNYYEDEMQSGARGRSPVTGRYISRGMSHMPHMPNRYYDDMSSHGYSGHSIRDRMIDKLEEMYDQAKTEHERDTVDMWIKRIRAEG